MGMDRGIDALDRAEIVAKVAMLFLLAAILVVGVFAARGLFADGAYFLFQML